MKRTYGTQACADQQDLVQQPGQNIVELNRDHSEQMKRVRPESEEDQRASCMLLYFRFADSVKTRSNSFHSTLEPNTEVFSKVSRSLAQFTLVNSVSTLLNKGGMSCNCPKASQDFCVNQNKQASAQLLCSSLVLSRHERSEGLRNSCEAEKAHLLRATCTSSRMSQGHLWCLHHGQLKTCHACQNHVTNMPRFMPMFVQVKTPINLKKDRSRAHKRKHIFLLTNVRSYPLGLPEQGSTG